MGCGRCLGWNGSCRHRICHRNIAVWGLGIQVSKTRVVDRGLYAAYGDTSRVCEADVAKAMCSCLGAEDKLRSAGFAGAYPGTSGRGHCTRFLLFSRLKAVWSLLQVAILASGMRSGSPSGVDAEFASSLPPHSGGSFSSSWRAPLLNHDHNIRAQGGGTDLARGTRSIAEKFREG
jgi:hypothetical protein